MEEEEAHQFLEICSEFCCSSPSNWSVWRSEFPALSPSPGKKKKKIETKPKKKKKGNGDNKGLSLNSSLHSFRDFKSLTHDVKKDFDHHSKPVVDLYVGYRHR